MYNNFVYVCMCSDIVKLMCHVHYYCTRVQVIVCTLQVHFIVCSCTYNCAYLSVVICTAVHDCSKSSCMCSVCTDVCTIVCDC